MTNSNPIDKARSNDTIQKVAPPPVPKSTKQRNDKDSDTSPKNGNEHGAKFVEKFGKKFETPAKKSKNLKDSSDPKEDKTESKRTESKRDKSAQSPEETTKTDANALAKDDDGAATCGEEKSKSDDDGDNSLYAVLPDNDSTFERFENNEALKSAMNTLNDTERKLVNYRFFESLSQSETAKKLGVSQMFVSRLERKVLAKLKEYLKEA